MAQLIAGGANVHAVDGEGFTALFYATKEGDVALVQLLKDAGAEVSKYAEGSLAVAWMAAAAAGDCSRVQAILDDGVDVNLKHASNDEPQATALKHAAANEQPVTIAPRLHRIVAAKPLERLMVENCVLRETP